MCDTWKIHDKKDMTFSDFKRILKKLKRSGIEKILFTGYGEPLMHKEFPHFVNYAYAQGFKLHLVTNATLINKNMIDTLKKFERIRVSADSIKNYQKIRGKDKFRTVIKNIRLLKKNGLDVRVGALIMPSNYKEIKSIINFYKKEGVKVYVGPTISSPPIAAKELALDYKAVENAIKIIKGGISDIKIREECVHQFKVLLNRYKNGKIRGGCIFPLAVVFILPGGDVMSCCGTNSFFMGNILKQSLNEIFKKNDDRIAKILFGEDKNCNQCIAKQPISRLILDKIRNKILGAG